MKFGRVLKVTRRTVQFRFGWRRYDFPAQEVGKVKEGDLLNVRLDKLGKPVSAKLSSKPHVCKRWMLNSYTGGGKFGVKVTLECTECGFYKEREATREEAKFLRPSFGFKQATSVHKVAHEYDRRFKGLSGYELIVKVERWAKKYPDDVRLVSVDDSHFAGSLLVLIEHRTKTQYMGTSAIIIPQCTGEAPIQFFLYPGHRRELMRALASIEKVAVPVQAREKAARLRDQAQSKKLFSRG